MDPVSTLLSLVTIPLTFFLPGYFTYSAVRHEGSDGQGVVTLQKILMPILISVVITSWISMALLVLGVFSLASVLSLIGIYTFLVALRFRRKINLRRLPKIIIDRRTVFLILLVIVAVVLFFRPFEETFEQFFMPLSLH
jgi:TRAP-type C4-dicarboxylate transport system permease large subunit